MKHSKKCKQCKREFEKPQACSVRRFLERTKFCSKICSSKSMMDKSPRFKKCVHCKKEFQRPTDYSNKMWVDRKFCSNLCDVDYRSLNLSANDPKWKGEEVGYRQLHAWVTKHKGRPTTCEFCSRKNLYGRSIHWANVDGKYQRNLDDYIRLCVKCHSCHDHSVGYLSKRNSLSIVIR